MQRFKTTHINNNLNSNSSQSNNILQYVNIIDKCTQILREDRIWLRNQLKANNQDIIHIFKNAKKPFTNQSNMQNLQIKLRKYITLIKSKTKNQQLIKFKENLLNTCTLVNPLLNNNQPFHQTLYLNKTINQRSQNKSNSKLNNNFNVFQNRSKSPIVQNTKNLSQSKPDNYSRYQQINFKQKRIKQTKNNLQKINQHNHKNNKNNTNSQVYEQKNQFTFLNKTNNFNKTLKQLNQYQNVVLNNQPRLSLTKRQKIISAREYYNENQQKNQNKNNFYNLKKNQQQNKEQIVCFENSKQQKISKNIQKNYLNQNNKNKYDKSLCQPYKNNFNYSSLHSNNDNLFTSPQLLNQCRRFIQQQKSGNKKIQRQINQVSDNYQPNQKQKINKTSEFDDNFAKYFNYGEDYSSQNQIYQQSINKQQDISKQSNNLSQQKYEQNQEICQLSSNRKNFLLAQDKRLFLANNSIHNLSNINTFNSYSNHRQNDQMEILNQDQNMLSSYNHQYCQKNDYENKFSDKQNFASDDISLREDQDEQDLYKYQSENVQRQNKQYFIKNLIDELIPYFHQKKILEQDFLNVIPFQVSKQVRKNLSKKLNEFITVIEVVKILSNINFVKKIQQNRNSVFQIYRILDIDKKGYINSEDIQSFLKQLQDAQVQCLQQVGQKLWRLYYMSQIQDKVQYWSLYILKDKQQFSCVRQILQQFQFQIEE